MSPRPAVGAVAVAAVVAVAMTVASAQRVGATIGGPCSASGLAASSGVDITTERVWHLRSTDIVTGEGTASRPQTAVRITIATFGISLPFAPLVDRNGGAVDHGSGGPFRISDYSRFARVLAVHGTTNDCSGDLIIVIDDVSPLGSLAGLLALLLALAGLAGMVGAGFVRQRSAGRVLGGMAGFIGGIGLAELLQQGGFLDPTSLRDLAIPAGAVLAGLVLASSFASLPGRRPPLSG